jgi:alpha-L-fucosidase 2
MAWEGGKLMEARIRSHLGGPCRVRYGEAVVELETRKGREYRLDGALRTIP